MNFVNEISQQCLGKNKNKAVRAQRKTSRGLGVNEGFVRAPVPSIGGLKGGESRHCRGLRNGQGENPPAPTPQPDRQQNKVNLLLKLIRWAREGKREACYNKRSGTEAAGRVCERGLSLCPDNGGPLWLGVSPPCPDNGVPLWVGVSRCSRAQPRDPSNIPCRERPPGHRNALAQQRDANGGMCVSPATSPRLCLLGTALSLHPSPRSVSAPDPCQPQTHVSPRSLSAPDLCQPQTHVSPRPVSAPCQWSAPALCQPQIPAGPRPMSAPGTCQPQARASPRPLSAPDPCQPQPHVSPSRLQPCSCFGGCSSGRGRQHPRPQQLCFAHRVGSVGLCKGCIPRL